MSNTSDTPVLKLEESWAYQVTVLADIVSRRMSELVGAHSDLNLSQWRVMAAIADEPGRTASQVNEVTPMDKGIVSRSARTLIEKGYAERRPSNTDGRAGHLHLTTAGQNVYGHIVEALSTTGADGRRCLDDLQNEHVRELLKMVIDRYQTL